jgi:transcriptional regulator with XRE-family HTH domain
MTWKRYPKAEEVAFYLRLGQNIYQLRKSRKISQEELAWRADCSQKYISNIELGKARASAVLCARIAAALHCSIDALFADILSREQTEALIVTASERALMHEVLRAVEEYRHCEK